MRKINTKTLQDILKVASVIAAVGLLFIILILARVLDSRLKDGSPKDRTAYEESISNSESTSILEVTESVDAESESTDVAEEDWESGDSDTEDLPHEASSAGNQSSSTIESEESSITDDSQFFSEESSSEEVRPTGGWGVVVWD